MLAVVSDQAKRHRENAPEECEAEGSLRLLPLACIRLDRHSALGRCVLDGSVPALALGTIGIGAWVCSGLAVLRPRLGRRGVVVRARMREVGQPPHGARHCEQPESDGEREPTHRTG